jgi:hypothetical protein
MRVRELEKITQQVAEPRETVLRRVTKQLREDHQEDGVMRGPNGEHRVFQVRYSMPSESTSKKYPFGNDGISWPPETSRDAGLTRGVSGAPYSADSEDDRS